MKAIPLHQDAILTEAAFEDIFKKYFKPLHAYAFSMIRDEAVAEGIVQNVFLKLWEREATHTSQNLNAPYLYRSVHNACLNYIKHLKVKRAYQQHSLRMDDHKDNSAGSRIALNELEQQLNLALNQLPQQCRTIFEMSRFSEMKYQEIADELGLSIKTVESQMGKALKILRKKLSAYLSILLCILY